MAHLHIHFSGIISTDILLNTLYSKKWRSLIFYNYKKKSLSFTLSGKRGNLSQKILKEIQEVLSSSSDDFDVIGNLFYGIIKDIRFYKTYVQLISEHMKVDHLECRLRLGTLRDKNGNFLSIEEEISLLSNCIQNTRRSIKIIPQYSKHKSKLEVYQYFISIIRYLAEYPQYRHLIVAFDLTGDEKTGKSLWEFEDVILLILNEMEEIRIQYSLPSDWSIPFFFHAGEISGQKGIDNIRFAIKYGGFHPLTRDTHWKAVYDKDALYATSQLTRIGHGVYSVYNDELIQEILKHEILLEFCPLSMVHFGNMSQDLIPHLINTGISFCINADDPNKIDNTDLHDNIQYLLDHNVSEEIINIALKNAIFGAQCSHKYREKMLLSLQ